MTGVGDGPDGERGAGVIGGWGRSHPDSADHDGRSDGTAAEKRQPRQSREALRDLMLQTGRAVLIEEGLGIRTDTLSFKRVFERVEADTGIRLSNASIIRRVWDNQADYQADVLASIAAQEGLGEFDKTIQALGPVIEGLDLSTPEGRARSLREVCRIGGGANILMLLESPNWSLWIAVWSLATADARPGDEQRDLYQQPDPGRPARRLRQLHRALGGGLSGAWPRSSACG